MKKFTLIIAFTLLTLPLHAVVIKLGVTVTAHAKINALKRNGVRDPISLGISLTGIKDDSLNAQLAEMQLSSDDEDVSLIQGGNELSIPCSFLEKGQKMTVTRDTLTIDDNATSATHVLIEFNMHTNDLLNIDLPATQKIAIEEDDVVLTLDYLSRQGFFFTES